MITFRFGTKSHVVVNQLTESRQIHCHSVIVKAQITVDEGRHETGSW